MRIIAITTTIYLLIVFPGFSSLVFANQRDNTPQEFRELWSEYTSKPLTSSEENRQWAIRVQSYLQDHPNLQVNSRLMLIREAAVLFQACGDQLKTTEFFEKLLSEAELHEIAEYQFEALNYLANKIETPKNRKECDKLLLIVNKTFQVLARPPKGSKERFRHLLANLYFELGKKLLETVAKTADLSGRDRAVFFGKGIKAFEIFCDLGDFTLDSKASALYHMAKGYESMSEKKKAAELYKEISSLPDAPFAPSYSMYLAVNLLHPRQGDPERIKALEDVSAKLKPDSYTNAFKQLLSADYSLSQQWDKAIDILTQIQNKDSDAEVNAYNMYLLSVALRSSGRVQAADDVLKKLRATYPNTEIAGADLGPIVPPVNVAESNKSPPPAKPHFLSQEGKWVMWALVTGLLFVILGWLVLKKRRGGDCSSRT